MSTELDTIQQIQHPKKARFLEVIKATGVVTVAAKAARVHRLTHYDWLKNDPDYPAAFADAMAEADDGLLAESRRRAFENKDNTMLIVEMKRRGLFNDRHEVTGAGGGPIEHRVMSEEDRGIMQRMINKRFTESN